MYAQRSNEILIHVPILEGLARDELRASSAWHDYGDRRREFWVSTSHTVLSEDSPNCVSRAEGSS